MTSHCLKKKTWARFQRQPDGSRGHMKKNGSAHITPTMDTPSKTAMMTSTARAGKHRLACGFTISKDPADEKGACRILAAYNKQQPWRF